MAARSEGTVEQTDRSLGTPRGRRKRLLSGLKFDNDLYIRGRVDDMLVRQLSEALRSGTDLPPLLVDAETSRVVDGFHRGAAQKEVYGPEALVEVEEREFADEAEMFLECTRINSRHGRRLAPYDQARVVEIGQRLSVDRSRLAQVLSVRPQVVDKIVAERFGSELSTRNLVPLKNTIHHMRGKALTKEQMEANRKLSGHNQSFYANQLILLTETDLLNLEDRRLLERLAHLKDLLEGLPLPTPDEATRSA